VIDRVIALWSNPGEKVLTPFMGVGSEVYGAVMANRMGIGVELKTSYFNQATKNIAAGIHNKSVGEVGLLPLFSGGDDED
jgi:DNA modification methylase